jgi:hypothetical protein
MLLLDQTLISLEKQWVLAQATQVGNDYMAQTVEYHFTSIKSWVQAQYSQSKVKKKKIGVEEVAQWENVCPACAKPWVQYPSFIKLKKNDDEDKWC